MKNLENIQKMFDLFKIGDVVSGSIVTLYEGGAKVKTTGGCFGDITGEIPNTLEEGSLVQLRVCAKKDKMPIFEFMPGFLFDKVPQNATVCFVGPREIVIAFDALPETYGIYRLEMTPGLQKLKDGDKVVASGLTKKEQYYLVDKLAPTTLAKVTEPAAKEKVQPAEADILSPWSKEKVAEVFAKGSRKKYGKVELGRIYSVTPYGRSGKEVQFPDGQVGDLNVSFPKGWARALVRVVFISQGNRPSAELIRGDEKSSLAEEKAPDIQTEDLGKKSGKNKFRNDAVFNTALAQGSCYRAGGYWLGYNYKVPIKKGIPYFAPTNQDPKNIMEQAQVIVLRNLAKTFKEGDFVCAEISYIRREGLTHNYTFEVKILKVF